jgi:enoyl-CoA hydratase/carnithine racemase
MDEVRTERVGGVLRIQLNRPEKKNALNLAMYEALAGALAAAESDPAVRALLLHGAGGAFTAGNDVKDFLRAPALGGDHPAVRFIRAVAGAPKPIVAAVSGPVVGIGTTMLAHCDLVFAAEDARFHLPFVDLGLCPEMAASYLFPALMGHPRAAELMLLAEPFGAAKAREYGLVNEVVPGDRLLAVAGAAAEKLARKPPAALRVTKSLLKRAPRAAVEAAVQEELTRFAERLASPEAREALTAFLEKRPPDFSRFS